VSAGPRAARLLLGALGACLAFASTASARYDGNLNFFLGQKWLDQSDWEPVDRQLEIGLMLAFGIERAPIHFALDAFTSEASETVDSSILGAVDVKSSVQEFAIGVRKVWNLGVTRPILGAGGCMVMAEIDYDAPGFRASFEDNDYGLWIEGGVMWRVGKRANLGLDLRYSWAEGKFTRNGVPADVKTGGVHAGAIVGFGW
jgi:hypothetical protein